MSSASSPAGPSDQKGTRLEVENTNERKFENDSPSPREARAGQQNRLTTLDLLEFLAAALQLAPLSMNVGVFLEAVEIFE